LSPQKIVGGGEKAQDVGLPGDVVEKKKGNKAQRRKVEGRSSTRRRKVNGGEKEKLT